MSAPTSTESSQPQALKLKPGVCPTISAEKDDESKLRISSYLKVISLESISPDYVECEYERDVIDHFKAHQKDKASKDPDFVELSDAELRETYSYLGDCRYKDHQDHKEICLGRLGPTYKSCTNCAVSFCDGCWAHNVKHGGHSVFSDEARFDSLEELESELAKVVNPKMNRDEKYIKLYEKTQGDWQKWKEGSRKLREEEDKVKERLQNVVFNELLNNSKMRDAMIAVKRVRDSLSPSSSDGSSGATARPVKKKARKENLDEGDGDDEKRGEGSSRC